MHGQLDDRTIQLITQMLMNCLFSSYLVNNTSSRDRSLQDVRVGQRRLSDHDRVSTGEVYTPLHNLIKWVYKYCIQLQHQIVPSPIYLNNNFMITGEAIKKSYI